MKLFKKLPLLILSALIIYGADAFVDPLSERVAFHESGHTIMTLLFPDAYMTLSSVTIAKPNKMGDTAFFSIQKSLDKLPQSYKIKAQLMYLIMYTAGAAAEELRFGNAEHHADDYIKTQEIAQRLLAEYPSDMQGHLCSLVHEYGCSFEGECTTPALLISACRS